MQILSLRTLLRTLSLSLVVVVGLSIVGCDSGGSNGSESSDSPAWVGNWKRDSEEDLVESEARSYTKEGFVTVQSDTDGECNKYNISIDDVSEGNLISYENTIGASTERRLKVSDDGSTLTVDQPEGGSVTWQSADDSKTLEEIADCSY